MGIIIIVTTIIIYSVAIVWGWNNLDEIEKPKKIAIIILSALVTYLITLMIFAMSKSGISYQEIADKKEVKTTIVSIFTGVNLLISLPFVSKQLGKMIQGEIETKELVRKLTIFIVIFIICIWIECGYMKNIQNGIVQIYQLKK